MRQKPSLRVLAGMLGLVLGLAVYALLVMQAGVLIAFWPIALQTIFYAVVGIVWILPARALMRWAARRQD